MMVHTGVLVLGLTVFTSPVFLEAIRFDPQAPLTRPWTILTSMFVHAGALHLAINLLFLYLFGPAVEAKLGGRRFLQLYLACGLGAGIFGALLASFVSLPPLLGASGSVLGVALAFALLWPDSEVTVFPIPVPLSAATLLGILVVLDILGALRFAEDGIAHFAHLGGLVTSYAWFRLQRLHRPDAAPAARPARHPVMATQLLARQEEHAVVVPPPPARPEPALPARERDRAELDRLLDKISAGGLESLTAEERRQLEVLAEKKRDGDALA
jgi:membrane associated rhomboid family serine protease